jgi:hypothetical protein
VQAERDGSVPGGAGRDRRRRCGGDQVVSCEGGSSVVRRTRSWSPLDRR